MSKKQSTIALSSTEAEYNALSETIREALWYKNLISELGLKTNGPIHVEQDNKSTIAIAMNPIRQRHVKHIDIKLKFIEEHLRLKDVILTYCPTELMIADILTKALAAAIFIMFRSLMGMRSYNEAIADNGSIKFADIAYRK